MTNLAHSHGDCFADHFPSQPYALTIDFPEDVWAQILVFSKRMGTTPDALVVAAVFDALPQLHSRFGISGRSAPTVPPGMSA